MRKFHLKTTLPEKEALPTLKRYTPHSNSCYTADSQHKPEVMLIVDNNTYALLPALPDDDVVLTGYLYNKPVKQEETLKGILVSGGKRYPLHDHRHGDIIGYLPLGEKNAFAAVTQKDFPGIFPLPFILILLLVLVIWLLPWIHMIGVPVVVYSNDPVAVGSITADRIEPLETDYFNIKINATPILENGRINIRIENSKRNTLDCRVEITVDLDEGETVIYNSPLLAPNQSLEYATVETDLPQGSHAGTATFHYFEGEEQLTTTSSVRLTIHVR